MICNEITSFWNDDFKIHKASDFIFVAFKNFSNSEYGF